MSKQHRDYARFCMGIKPIYNPNKPRAYREDREKAELLDHPVDSRISIEYIKNESFAGEFLKKEGNSANKIILYIHGGGFAGGSAKTRRDITSFYALYSGLNIYANNYPLAPEDKFPKAQEACFKAYKYLVSKYGGNNIVLMGESAGGTLVLSTLLMAKDNNIELPCCAVVFSPATQFIEPTASYFRNDKKDAICASSIVDEVRNAYFKNKDDVLNPYASPLLGDYKGINNIYIIVSDSEVLFDDSDRLAKKLKESNVKYVYKIVHRKMHAFPMMAALPEAIAYNKKVIKYIQKTNNHK